MRHIVITSIHPPNKAHRRVCRHDGVPCRRRRRRRLSRWEHPNCTFLDVEAQKNSHRIVEQLPWNHYGRKITTSMPSAMALQRNDDDKSPTGHASDSLYRHNPSRPVTSSIYTEARPPSQSGHGTTPDQIQADDNSLLPENLEPTQAPIGLWQGLADLDLM